MKKKILLFTVFYVLCEIIYNLSLVEFLSNSNTELSVYNRLEFFGKGLASIGFSLFIINFIKTNKKLIFAILLPAVFFAQTFIFQTIVESIPEDKALTLYTSGVYRNAVLNNTLSDERLTNQNSYNKVLTAVIPALTTIEDKTSDVNEIFTINIADEVVDEFYNNYEELNSKITPFWIEYLRNSKRYDNYPKLAKKKIDSEFIKKIGLPQGLSKEEFYRELRNISPSIKQYEDVIIIPANDKLNIDEVRGKDFKLGMSKNEFILQFNGIVNNIKSKTNIQNQDFKNLPHSKELLTAVVIPPIAILLSFLAIILNLSVILKGIKKPLAVIPALGVAVVFATYTENPYNINTMVSKAIGVEATLHNALKPLANTIKYVSISEDNPNEYEIIRITRPKPIDFTDLEDSMSSLSTMDLPEDMLDDSVIADVERLENDSLYFGELNKKNKINPYTGKPY